MQCEWISNTDAEADGGTLSTTGNTYLLKKKNGKWKVIKDKLLWVS